MKMYWPLVAKASRLTSIRIWVRIPIINSEKFPTMTREAVVAVPCVSLTGIWDVTKNGRFAIALGLRRGWFKRCR
jgi:hypothetical protein